MKGHVLSPPQRRDSIPGREASSACCTYGKPWSLPVHLGPPHTGSRTTPGLPALGGWGKDQVPWSLLMSGDSVNTLGLPSAIILEDTPDPGSSQPRSIVQATGLGATQSLRVLFSFLHFSQSGAQWELGHRFFLGTPQLLCSFLKPLLLLPCSPSFIIPPWGGWEVDGLSGWAVVLPNLLFMTRKPASWLLLFHCDLSQWLDGECHRRKGSVCVCVCVCVWPVTLFQISLRRASGMVLTLVLGHGWTGERLGR